MTKSGVEYLAQHPGWKTTPAKPRLTITAREFDTILAALRLYQEHEPAEIRTEIQDIASGEHGKPLTIDEIDDLIERIN